MIFFCEYLNISCELKSESNKIYPMTPKPTLFYLSTCSTCKRIIDGLANPDYFHFQDIKTESIRIEQLEQMIDYAGSVDKLFSKRAMKYRSLGLNEKELSDQEMKDWILKEYTFLNRPVLIMDGKIFIGSSKSNVEALYEAAKKI